MGLIKSERLAWLRRKEPRGLAIGILFGMAGVGVFPNRAADSGVDWSTVIAAFGRPFEAEAAKEAATETDWDLPNLDHERVDFWIEEFTTDSKDRFGRFMHRKGRYEDMIRTKLAERNMPEDLVYLAMIESGFNPEARSVARAVGMWQFIRETGERYGLEVNRAVDERMDPIAATDAALDYLQDLHERLGSWYLAAAAYNTGENRVARIMREETGSERGTDADYYRIWNRLPAETRDYVPLMIAAARISKAPQDYGFGEIEPAESIEYREITARPNTSLAAIARAEGITVDAILALNPQFKLKRTRNDAVSVVRIPSASVADE